MLANSKYHQLDSTQPIFDIAQQSYGVPIPFSANMENKVGPVARNLMFNLSKGCTALYRRNLMGIAYYNAVNVDNFEVSSQVAHSLNLVNDIAFFVEFHKAAQDRMQKVKDTLPAFGGKLFQFVQYISNIGNRCGFNLRDVYHPLSTDRDFTASPGSTDLAVGSLNQAVIDQQISEFINYENADAASLQNLYSQTANLQISPYILDKQLIAQGSTYYIDQQVFPGYDANGNPVYYNLQGQEVQWQKIQGSGPYLGGTPSSTSGSVPQSNPPEIVSYTKTDKGQLVAVTNLNNRVAFNVDFDGPKNPYSKTTPYVISPETGKLVPVEQSVTSTGLDSRDVYGIATNNASRSNIETYSFEIKDNNGTVVYTNNQVLGFDSGLSRGFGGSNYTRPEISSKLADELISQGIMEYTYSKQTAADGSTVLYPNGVTMKGEYTVTVASNSEKVTVAPQPASTTFTPPYQSAAAPAPQIDTTAATAERPQVNTTPNTTSPSVALPPATVNGNVLTTSDISSALNYVQSASTRLFSNRQRVIPFTFQIRTEDIDGAEVYLNVDYLLKKVVLDNSDQNKTIATLEADKYTNSSTAIVPGSGQTVEQYRRRLRQVTAKNKSLTPGGIDKTLQQAGVSRTNPVYGKLYNQLLKVYEQRALTGNTLTQAVGTFINLASSRIPTNLLANITRSTGLYNTIASKFSSIGGTSLIPGSSQLISALNPFKYVNINLSNVIPSVGLGSLKSIASVASQVATSGPPTSVDGAFELLAQVKDLICNFELPFINIDNIKTLLKTKFKPEDIWKAIKEEETKILQRIGDFFKPENIFKNIWKPIEKQIKAYFTSLYKKLFVCDENAKQNKTGKPKALFGLPTPK